MKYAQSSKEHQNDVSEVVHLFLLFTSNIFHNFFIVSIANFGQLLYLKTDTSGIAEGKHPILQKRLSDSFTKKCVRLSDAIPIVLAFKVPLFLHKCFILYKF